MNATLAFVFLAEQCVAVFLGPVGKVNYKGFHLLAGSLTEEVSAAEVDGVGLDEVGIELMLADELARSPVPVESI